MESGPRVSNSETLEQNAGWRSPVGILVGVERVIFTFVGLLFFVAAFALMVRATSDLWALIAGSHDQIIFAGTAFLDLMLLVLMMVELAYTVIMSLRGAVLAAEPFLIVGLIAIIRRMLVITISGVGGAAEAPIGGAVSAKSGQPIELAILTGVVLVLVLSIVLLRARQTGESNSQVH